MRRSSLRETSRSVHFTEIPSAESLDLPPQAPDLLLKGFGLRGLRVPLPLELLGQPP